MKGPPVVPKRDACISNGSSSPQPALDRVFYSLALDTIAQLILGTKQARALMFPWSGLIEPFWTVSN